MDRNLKDKYFWAFEMISNNNKMFEKISKLKSIVNWSLIRIELVISFEQIFKITVQFCSQVLINKTKEVK